MPRIGGFSFAKAFFISIAQRHFWSCNTSKKCRYANSSRHEHSAIRDFKPRCAEWANKKVSAPKRPGQTERTEDMKTVIIDSRAGKDIERALEGLGFSVLQLPPCPALPEAISAHPDTLIYKLKSGKLLMTEEYYRQNRNIFDSRGIGVRLTDKPLGDRYPLDIQLNALRISDTVYGRSDCISDIILSEEEGAKKVVHVKQGYARCSVAVLSDKAAITADSGLAAALEANGVAVLRISPGSIVLNGYDYGFIGGAGGLLSPGVYAFFGKIKAHPEGELLACFAERNNVRIVELSNEPLHDYGGLIVL